MLALNISCGGTYRLSSKMVSRAMPIVLATDQVVKLQSHVSELNNGHDVMKNMTRWMLGNKVCGYMSASFTKTLNNYPEVFSFDDHENTVTLHSRLQRPDQLEERTKEIARVNADLRTKGIIKGWRDELFPVAESFARKPEVLIERASVPHFGAKAYGVHVNGYIRSPTTGQISYIWAGKRCATKSTYPGMLDHIVAGGIPYGIGVTENMIKECSEEASIPEALARTTRQTDSISYNYADAQGNLKRDEIFCFDLELPTSFVPVPQDGEVESFHLFDVHTVLEKVLEAGPRGFKPNCNLAIIDFLLR